MTEPKPPEAQLPESDTSRGRGHGSLSSSMPATPGPVLSGRDDATPVRAFSRVALVIFVVFAIVCAVAYGLWTSLN
jgi:hypothetical protein